MRRTWSEGFTRGGEEHHKSLDDLLAHLDDTAAAGRDADALRADRDPRIPKLEHLISYEWRPPPPLEEVRKTVSAESCRRFNRSTKHCGDIFHQEGILRHAKAFNVWETDRMVNGVPERSVKNPKGRPGLVKYHAHSEPLLEPHDKMLHPLHRKWLKQHLVQRERYMYPVYHALVRVDKAEEKAREIQKQRETARDLMTRSSLHNPELSKGVKAKLGKARMAISTTRVLNKLGGIDAVAEDEKKNEDAVHRAKKHPHLALKPPTPRERCQHIRSFKGPDRRQKWAQTDNLLKHTTPGKDQEEELELHKEPRYRARGA